MVKNLNSGFGVEKRFDKVFQENLRRKGVFDGDMLASVFLIEKTGEKLFLWRNALKRSFSGARRKGVYPGELRSKLGIHCFFRKWERNSSISLNSVCNLTKQREFRKNMELLVL